MHNKTFTAQGVCRSFWPAFCSQSAARKNPDGWIGKGPTSCTSVQPRKSGESNKIPNPAKSPIGDMTRHKSTPWSQKMGSQSCQPHKFSFTNFMHVPPLVLGTLRSTQKKSAGGSNASQRRTGVSAPPNKSEQTNSTNANRSAQVQTFGFC